TGLPAWFFTSMVSVVRSAASTGQSKANNRINTRIAPSYPYQKVARGVRRAGHRLGREITAANRALHRRRPTGSRPIPGQEEVRKFRDARWPQMFQPWPRRKRGTNFL